jgi:hypothetical protein
MPTYMKAFRLADLQRYPGWSIRASASGDPQVLDADAIVYLREDCVVVRDCFSADVILFQSDETDWQRFCREELGFDVPAEQGRSPREQARLAPDPGA